MASLGVSDKLYIWVKYSYKNWKSVNYIFQFFSLKYKLNYFLSTYCEIPVQLIVLKINSNYKKLFLSTDTVSLNQVGESVHFCTPCCQCWLNCSSVQMMDYQCPTQVWGPAHQLTCRVEFVSRRQLTLLNEKGKRVTNGGPFLKSSYNIHIKIAEWKSDIQDYDWNVWSKLLKLSLPWFQ